MITIKKFTKKDDPYRILQFIVYCDKSISPKIKIEVSGRRTYIISQVDSCGGVKTLITVDDKQLAYKIAQAFAEIFHDNCQNR